MALGYRRLTPGQLFIHRERKCAENYILNVTINLFFNQHFTNFKTRSFRVLFDKNHFCVFNLKNIVIFQRRKRPAQRTGTVPTVSAHFRSLLVDSRGVLYANRRDHSLN